MFHPEGPTFVELAVQALSSTERGYDLLATKFEHTPFRTPDEVLACVAPLVGACGEALDVCCGTGAGMRMLRSAGAGRVVGLDFSHGMLCVGKQLLADLEGLEWVQGDALALPFEDASFDVVTCFGAIGHFEDHRAFVREARRVLRVGGRLVFVTSAPLRWTDWEYWACLLFNLVMRVRNWLVKPEFVMYYLGLQSDEARRVLSEEAFEVSVHGGMPRRYHHLRTVVGVRRS